MVESNGTTISAPGYEVLVLYNGGTVCANSGYFNSYSARAICREMGYKDYNGWSTGYRHSIQDNYPITLGNVDCDRSYWYYSGIWRHCSTDPNTRDCSHYNDVYLDCLTGEFS